MPIRTKNLDSNHSKFTTRNSKLGLPEPGFYGQGTRNWFSPKGQAMAEILVALPVLLLILSAVIFLGEGYIYKARTIIAARYAVWTESKAGEEVTARDLACLFFDHENLEEKLTLETAPDEEPFAGKILSAFSSALGESSGTYGRTLSFTFRPGPGSDKDTILASTHYLDGNTWRDNSQPGKTLKYATWAIAGAEGLIGAGGGFIGTVGGREVKIPSF